MASPTSLLTDVRGMGRDFAIDGLPRGVVWDLIDFIPNRRGAKLEGRGAWGYLTTGSNLGGKVWGGKHAVFHAGAKLLVHAGGNLYDHPTVDPGAATSIGALFSTGLQNGTLLTNRVYFADGAGALVPKAVTYTGTFAITPIHASAPKVKVLDTYKERLIGAGAIVKPERVYFSQLEVDGGPLGAWDPESYVDTSRAVTALAPMSAQILVFHSKSIEKIRGAIPPGADLDTDMFTDMFSEQMGCEDPASVCNWQENVIFANSRGVHLTDGATIRSLSDQGAIGDFWRTLYSRKRANTQVVAGVFLDYLYVTVLTDYTPPGGVVELSVTFVCDLNNRTWFRFSNIPASCYIESESGEEEVFVGLYPDNRIVKVSPTFYGNIDLPEEGVTPPPTPNAIDGNGLAVLPQVDLGWKRLGPEGVKRMRHIYVSHQTQVADPLAKSGISNVFDVQYQVNVGTEILSASFISVGQIANAQAYSRARLNVGRRGYGIRCVVKQIAPTYLTRLYDVQVDEWAQDQGKL